MCLHVCLISMTDSYRVNDEMKYQLSLKWNINYSLIYLLQHVSDDMVQCSVSRLLRRLAVVFWPTWRPSRWERICYRSELSRKPKSNNFLSTVTFFKCHCAWCHGTVSLCVMSRNRVVALDPWLSVFNRVADIYLCVQTHHFKTIFQSYWRMFV